ncbi:MAG: Mo-dependent nitrogenase C-terminal domain-containing protein [Microcoleus sp. PH2017_29_MFU_D_A]|uniref:Mo-dependent nitrogenase C-terminal domain-containing protein n=1 Tax=unclassified Microcoleus TaxID=2642155 RepID=UPI001DB4F28D|nr:MULTISPECIES: Mo-dependent nitrogenase C-terminal domain-containing protein [unclassified Microcoleus]MCC3419221.1 Mo-dependent nitrogenase C-terminal domain-containing protein [Microcoleus sp. PH2017_07_MST_O_A]MCC3428764.1 Mo-dependent nitrogenase C-terminal domain-containing protein [Microcoleus sp. PH2017_04_SCI_O_A]MCC3443551.1 Mo-dependent nitrogenase C-terminal domain-containing protein [Microcoleus sp. PH2017_03_ELD_O_A]MCC3465613.1 Mo-dependent nitrogenase C-terminal domain-containi
MNSTTSILPKNQCRYLSFGQILVQPVRHWFDSIAVGDRQIAKWLCQVIPARCPFERNIQLFGHHFFHIPPMCKLNPVYEELVGLRFRSLSFLADVSGEDVTPYC